MDKNELKEYLEFAKNMAEEAGKLMQHYYRLDHEIEIKDDSSPVTIADKTINTMLIKKVKLLFPGHGVMGEEESYKAESEYLWVCDPIDGTVAYIQHVPTSVFSLALVVNGEPVVAVVCNPWTNDLYHAVKNGGAFRGDEPIKVSSRKWGEDTLLVGSSHRSRSIELFDHPDFISKLREQKIHISNFPGSVFKGCLIAEGSLDGRTFMHNGAHDIAAVKLIIEEAGGSVTDLNGKEQPYNRPINGAIMSNGLIHNELIELLEKYANTGN